MTIITCDATECINNDNLDCKCPTIMMSFDGCVCYADIRGTKEYQDTFWARVIADRNNPDRSDENARKRKERGKRIEYGGLVFYTQHDIRTKADQEEAYLTEEKTGYLAGNYADLVKNIELIKKQVAEFTGKPVSELEELDEQGIYDRILSNS